MHPKANELTQAILGKTFEAQLGKFKAEWVTSKCLKKIQANQIPC